MVLAAPIAFGGPNGALQVFGVTLIGATAENGRKLVLTLALLVIARLLSLGLGWVASAVVRRSEGKRVAFWSEQGVAIAVALLTVLGILSIWFDDPGRLTTAMGLVTAGLAFALQRVITALAGYVVILRGRTFNVGDRIVMGGVRGDVIALSFTQTTILEMGEPPPEQADAPAIWVRSRQYTGRICTVTNAKVFDEPIYNYTRDLPFLFEEMTTPVRFGDDHARAESILLEAARRHTADLQEVGREALEALQKRYQLGKIEPGPRVYWRLTDNWVEMTVRFLARDHGVRERKDAMSREILAEFGKHDLQIASSSMVIAGVPRLEIARVRAD